MLSLDMLLSCSCWRPFMPSWYWRCPSSPWLSGTRLISLIQNARLPLTPVIETAARYVGVLLGSFLLAQHLPAGALSLTDVFHPRVTGTLASRSSSSSAPIPSAFPLMECWFQGSPISTSAPCSRVLLPALGVLLVCHCCWSGAPRPSPAVRNLLIAIWAAYATVYLICLFYWLLALLNFWAFLVAMLLIQFLRR